MFTWFQIFGHLAFVKKQITGIMLAGWLVVAKPQLAVAISWY